MGVHPCVNKVNSTGLRTQPCSAPVFRVRVDEVRLPTLTISLSQCGEGGVVQRSLQREKDSGDSGE